jgi:bifunctional DNA-binding transcriptional regulator/antitoxin component of YhaV-PrlF toxin-antitoxin module
MPTTRTLKASPEGRLTLPIEVRRRWALLRGGTVSYVDLGDALLVCPLDPSAGPDADEDAGHPAT